MSRLSMSSPPPAGYLTRPREYATEWYGITRTKPIVHLGTCLDPIISDNIWCSNMNMCGLDVDLSTMNYDITRCMAGDGFVVIMGPSDQYDKKHYRHWECILEALDDMPQHTKNTQDGSTVSYTFWEGGVYWRLSHTINLTPYAHMGCVTPPETYKLAAGMFRSKTGLVASDNVIATALQLICPRML